MSRVSTATGWSDRRDDAHAAGVRVLAALGAGVVAGVVFGGIGGRLAMLILRQRSPGTEGLTTDAGFEIGRVTLAGSLGLAVFGAITGIVFAVIYAAARLGLPGAARVPAAVLVGATFGGASFLEPDGIDLLVLESTWFAVVLFVVLPAAAAGTIAVLVERSARSQPWPAPWRIAPPGGLTTAARVIVTGGVALFIAAQGTQLIEDVTTIL